MTLPDANPHPASPYPQGPATPPYAIGFVPRSRSASGRRAEDPPAGGPHRPEPARSREPAPPSARTPLLLRATVGIALLAAVGASVVRARSGPEPDDALRAAAPTPVAAQNVAASRPASRSADRSAVAGAAASGCRVGYTVASREPGRITAVLTVVNTGRTTVDGWTLRWTYPPGSQLTDGWNATVLGDGGQVEASDAGLNRVIRPGGSTTIGFNLMVHGPEPVPKRFTLNGVVCR
jgi:hypothetical protein